MATVEERVDKLEVDVYFGDGKQNPPITTRLDRVEILLEQMGKLFWVAVAAIVTSLLATASTWLHH